MELHWRSENECLLIDIIKNDEYGWDVDVKEFPTQIKGVMRKILFTLLFCGVTLVGYSQTNISTSIDSLQNEYNFLKCKFNLYQVSNDLSSLGKDIDIKCNYIDIKRYHKMYYKPLSDVLEDSYDSYIYLKSSIEENYQSLKELIPIYYDNFSTGQKKLIDSNFIMVDAAIKKVDQSLKVYRMALDLYKNKE